MLVLMALLAAKTLSVSGIEYIAMTQWKLMWDAAVYAGNVPSLIRTM